MRFTDNSAKLSRLLPALAIPAILLTGCYDPANRDTSAVAVGGDLNFAGLELRSVLIVTSAQNEPGRILGTIVNTTSRDLKMVLSDKDDRVPVMVPAHGKITFDDSPLMFKTTQEPPGARTDLTVTVKGQETMIETMINVPVQNGTFQQYRPYVPTPST
jgi:hypothetical protein